MSWLKSVFNQVNDWALSEEDYNNFAMALDNAKNSLQDRESKLRDVYETLESDLELIGAIGIEDRLQENVKDTLIAMSQAGIKVCISNHFFILDKLRRQKNANK